MSQNKYFDMINTVTVFYSRANPLTIICHRVQTCRVVMDSAILAKPKFYALLEKEMSRSQRCGCCLSIITFKLPKAPRTKDGLHGFQKRLIRRVRSYDFIGWINSDTIGLLLPDTTEEGAQRLVHDIYKHNAIKNSMPTCAIFSIPSNEIDSLRQTMKTTAFMQPHYYDGQTVRHTIEIFKAFASLCHF